MGLGEGSSFFPWTMTEGKRILSAWWMYDSSALVLNRGSEAASRSRGLFFLSCWLNSLLELFQSASV